MNIMMVIILLVLAVDLIAAESACTQDNKQKALYAFFAHEPALSDKPAFEIETEVNWPELSSLRGHDENGIYNAFMVYFEQTNNVEIPSGYFGVQAKTGQWTDMLLFSLWDKNPGGDVGKWQAALPMHPNCDRNCQDCAVHTDQTKAPDGSTGTKCYVYIPTQHQSTTFRLNIKRVAVGSSAQMYGRTWIGDEYEVSITHIESDTKYVVGRQLVGASSAGINKMTTFHEHIGCTPCHSFEFASRIKGPWVLDPVGTRLERAWATAYDDDSWLCHAQRTSTISVGEFEFRTGTKQTYTSDAWSGSYDNPLYICDTQTDECAWTPADKSTKKPTEKPEKRPTPNRGHMIVYGDGKNSRKPQPECTSDYATKSIWGNKKIAVSCCKSTRGTSGGRPNCKQGLNYADAVRHCKSKRMLLCSKEQIYDGAAKGTGCNFDGYQVWTRSSCNGLGKKNHPTKKPAKKPTKKPTKRPDRGHMVYYGNGKDSKRPQPECKPDSSTRSIFGNKPIAVSCCKSTRGTSGSRPSCRKGLNYAAAEKHCKSKRMVLCSVSQIKAGAAKGSGCGFDRYQVWTRDSCSGFGKKSKAMSVNGLVDDVDVSEPFASNDGFYKLGSYAIAIIPFVFCALFNAFCAYKHCRNDDKIYEKVELIVENEDVSEEKIKLNEDAVI